jgi:hypothetical protein
MSERAIITTESEGTYIVQTNGFSEFELIGILECINTTAANYIQEK